MKISQGTIIRTVLLIAALVNQILTSTGHSVLPFNDEQITQMLTAVFTALASITAWWKNNSFTTSAIKADEYKEQIKGTK